MQVPPEMDLSQLNSHALDLVMSLEMPLSISFGSTELDLMEVLNLSVGAHIELNKTAADPVDVLVNGCRIACGELVVVDGNYGVRIREIASAPERLRTAGRSLEANGSGSDAGVN